MDKETYEEPNLVVLNGSGEEYDIQPMGLSPVFVLGVVLIVGAFVVLGGAMAIFGATQVHAVVNADTYVTVS